jgi:hypothetical protein
MKLQTMMRHILDPTKSDLSEEATNTYKIGFFGAMPHMLRKGVAD